MHKKRKKSYYFEILKNSMIVLLVPIVTMIVVCLSAQFVISTQIKQMSQNALKQFFYHVDSELKEVKEKCVMIANSEQSKLFAKNIIDKFDNRAFITFKQKQHLEEYAGEKYFDIFEYYPHVDYVVSANRGCMSLEKYFEINYTQNDVELWEKLKTIAETPYKKPVLYSLNEKGDDTYLCMAMRQSSYKTPKYDYVVVLVLRQSYIKELLTNIMDTEMQGIAILQSAKAEKLFATSDIVYEEQFIEKDYMLQRQKSEVIDIEYVYAIPNTYFVNKMLGLYIVLGIGITTAVAIGIYIVIRQTKKNYMPLKMVVEGLQGQTLTDYDAYTCTEFEFIENMFGEEKKEKERIERNIDRHNRDIVQANFIVSLLENKGDICCDADDIFKEHGMMLLSNCFCVVFFQIADTLQMSNQLKRFIVSNVYEELCNREGKGFVVSLNNTEHVILANLKHAGDKEKLLAVLEEGKEFLEHYYNMELTLGVSTVQEGSLGIHMAYGEAQYALSYSYLLGENIIIDYTDVAGREVKNLKISEIKMQNVVTDYLAGKRDKDAECLIEELVKSYGISQESFLEVIKCFTFEAISVLYKFLIKEGMWIAEWSQQVAELGDQETFEAFKLRFAEVLEQLYHKKHEGIIEEDVCAKVKSYIETHYMEEQLSRKQLGEMVHVAPGYLSKLFKEKYQFTIPEYISKTRVDKAKEELKNTKKSVQDIAACNGFVNSASFIRTFKKQEGVTPNVYRELSKE